MSKLSEGSIHAVPGMNKGDSGEAANRSNRVILVTGGARSGKSTFAEELTMKLAPEGSLYIATAQAFDDEMKDRIQHHQRVREESGYVWTSAECPLDLPERLEDSNQEGAATIMVDCLTVWLSNELLAVEQQPDVEELLAGRIARLEQALRNYSGTVILVTNEVGSGVVPPYKLGRVFRDVAGRLNQRIAALSEEVYLVTAGIPIELKGRMVQL